MLALSPVPSPHDPKWLAALSAFEQAHFHINKRATCDIPLPYGAPRFVVLADESLGEMPEVHTFTYYTAPEDLLNSFIPAIRTPSSYVSYVVEYLPAEKTFDNIEPVGVISGYTPDDGTVVYEARTMRLRNIAFSLGVPFGYSYTPVKESRFICTTRHLDGRVEFSRLRSFSDTASFIGEQSRNATGLVNFYDLDVSDQPIPIVISLHYTDVNGNVYEVAEPV